MELFPGSRQDKKMKIIYKPWGRSISMRVLDDGSLQVTVPKGMNQTQIERFVSDQSFWIEKQRVKQLGREQLETTESIYLFGKKYTKVVLYDEKNPIGFGIHADKLIYNVINPETSLTSPEYTKALERFLKNTAQAFILPKTSQLADTYKLTLGRITFRQQKTRWGSCSSQGNLNLNWRLVHFSPKAIEYIIAHELAHLTHHNHSREFWRLVAEYIPEYKKLQKDFARFRVHIT